MLVVRFLLILVIVAVMISFAAYNMDLVSLTLLPGSEPIPLPLNSIILLSLFAGALISYILSLVDRFSLSRRIREKEQENRKLRAELQALRNLPIVEDYKLEKHGPESGGEI